ncbi:MAG: polysaccharide pyruvyl transferase family protein [Acidimicrobiales bacterium]
MAAWIGSANLGDELVFAGLAGQLAARGVRVEALSQLPAATAAEHGVSAIHRRDLLRPGRGRGVEDRGVTVLGGGGLLQDETSTLNLDLHLAPVALARLRGEPTAGVGLGAGPLSTRLGRARVRRALADVPLTVRDAASADLLAGLGLPRPVVAADLALSLPAPTATPLDRVVVCLRPWSGQRHRVPARLRRHRADDRFAAGAARALDQLTSTTGLPVHLVAFDAPKDGPLHEAVANRMQHPPTLANPTRAQVLDEVAASRLVVAMRYHGGMAAVLAGRPTVLIGYSPKVDALALELGPGASARRWSADGLGDLSEAAAAVLDRGDDVLAARDLLVARERANGILLDQVLESGETAQ